MTPYIAVGLNHPTMNRFNRIREETKENERKIIVTTSETVQRVMALVCFNYQLTEEQLISKTRKRNFVLARMICMKLIRSNTSMILEDIGNVFNRDHSTVLYSIDTLNDLIETDNNISEQYLKIEKLL